MKYSIAVSAVICWCMMTCAPAAADLYFPHVDANSPWETEIRIINSSATHTASGTLRAYNNSGTEVSSAAALSLPPGAGRHFTVGSDFTDAGSIGYMIFETQSDTVNGFTKFYTTGKYRVAVPAAYAPSGGDLHLSHIASDSTWWTGISLVNPTAQAKNMTVVFSNSQTANISLAPGEHKTWFIKDFFGGASQPGIASAVIRGSTGVVGLELFGAGDQLSGILLSDASDETLYFPHVAQDDEWWTGVCAYNPSDSAVVLYITPFDASGSMLPPYNRMLAPKGKLLGRITDVGMTTNTAWFRISGTVPITGFELFGTNDNTQLGGYTAVNIYRKQGVFQKVEKAGWTGIALVNIGGAAASVDMAAYDLTGDTKATSTINLAAYEKRSAYAADFFPGKDISAAEYITYSSAQNLVGFQLNGSSDNMMLDALPTALMGTGPAPTVEVGFEQLDWESEAGPVQDSGWGRVTLVFNGYDSMRYFNLNVNGAWVVRNMSVASLYGSDVRQTLTTLFDLGTADGTDVSSLQYSWSMDAAPVGSMPSGTLSTAVVYDLDYRIGGEEGTSTLPPARGLRSARADSNATVVKSGKLADLGKFTNLPQGDKECVPGAVASSLGYLVARKTIPSSVPHTVAKLKEMFGTLPDGTTSQNWYADKKEHLEGMGITTDYITGMTSSDMDKLIARLKAGYDIELDLNGHAAVVVGVRVKSDGTIELDIFDDNQKKEGADPMRTVTVKDGKILGMEFQRFVCEFKTQTTEDVSMNFEQLDWFGASGETTDSSVGRLALTFGGFSELRYLNLAVNGSWVVRNMSVASVMGSGVSQTVSTLFDLGVADGTDVSELNYVYSLETSPSASAPTGDGASAEVVGTDYKIGGEGGKDIAPPDASETGTTDDAATVTKSAVLPDVDKVVNQAQGENECVPGAVSNSLNYLLARGKISDTVPRSIKDLKQILGTDESGTDQDWYQTKATYFKPWGVRTDYITGLTPTDIDTLIGRINAGEDVEVDLDGHVAMVVGVRVKSDGTVELDIYDDNQKKEGADPMRTVTIKDGKIDGLDFQRFVCEYKYLEEVDGNVSFEQLDWMTGSETITDSNVGRVTIDYTGLAGIGYFNLTLGDQWVVQNLSIDGSHLDSGQSDTVTILVNYDTLPGVDVASVEYAETITLEPQESKPTGTASIVVDSTKYKIGGEAAIVIDAPVIVVSASTPAGSKVKKSAKLKDLDKMVNQAQGDNECVPAAISNSLKYLQATGQLCPETVDSSIDFIKEIVGWSEDGTPQNWPDLKKEFFDTFHNTSTEFVEDLSSASLDKVIQALESGMDVELDLDGHAATVVGLRVKEDGTIELDIYDDNQEEAGADPVRTVTVRDGKVEGMDFDRFVLEDGPW